MARAAKKKAEDAVITGRRYGPPHDTALPKLGSHKAPPRKPGVKTAPIRGPPIERAAYSIDQFAQAHGLSVAMYFKLRGQGLGPEEMHVGRRRLISLEAAARWRAERTAASSDTSGDAA
jgi:hypothetical protein